MVGLPTGVTGEHLALVERLYGVRVDDVVAVARAGSFVYGTHRPDSDLDILVVTSKDGFSSRQYITSDGGVDILVVHVKLWVQWLMRGMCQHVDIRCSAHICWNESNPWVSYARSARWSDYDYFVSAQGLIRTAGAELSVKKRRFVCRTEIVLDRYMGNFYGFDPALLDAEKENLASIV